MRVGGVGVKERVKINLGGGRIFITKVRVKMTWFYDNIDWAVGNEDNIKFQENEWLGGLCLR